MGTHLVEKRRAIGAHAGTSSLFAGPFVNWVSPVCWPPPYAMTSSCSWGRRQRRVRLKQRGGFVPNEVTSPARSLVPAWAPLARLTPANRGPVRREMRSDSPAWGREDLKTVRLFSYPTQRG